MGWGDPTVRLKAEIERLISGYMYAGRVICEVAAEGTAEAAEQLRPRLMEVFDLYREPLQALWSDLGKAQQGKVLRLDGKLLAAEDDVRRLLGVSLSEHLERIKDSEQA